MEKNYQSMADFKPCLDPKEVREAPYKKMVAEQNTLRKKIGRPTPQEIDALNRERDHLNGLPPLTEEEIDAIAKMHGGLDPLTPKEIDAQIKEAEAAARYTNISPEDGRYRNQLQKAAPYLDEAAYVRARVIVETLWLRFLMNEVLPEGTLNLKPDDLQKMMQFADEMPVEFTLRVGQIEDERKHDVIGVIEAMREKFSDVLTPETEGFVHLGLTSEDVNDLSQKFMFINALNHVLYPEAIKLMETFREVGVRLDTLRDPKEYGSKTFVNGQSREQSLGLRYKKYADTILNSIAPVFVPDYLTMKFSGATGTHAAMGIIKKENITGREIGRKFCDASGLDLHYLEATAQINPHDDFVLWALHALDLVTELEKMQSEIWDDSGTDYHMEGEIVNNEFAGKSSMEGKRLLFIKPDKNQSGSSAMPQKVQVINIENAEGTAQMIKGTLNALIETLSQNRQQRKLSDSKKIREILGKVLPQIFHMLLNMRKDIVKLEPNPECTYKGEADLIKEPVKNQNQDRPHLEDFEKFLGNVSRSIGMLDDLAVEHAATPILGKTHNQPASPLTLGLVFKTYADRLQALEKTMCNYQASPSRILKQVEETTKNEANNYYRVVQLVAENLKSDLKLYRRRDLLDFEEFTYSNGEIKIDDLIVNEPDCAEELENHYECLGEAIQTVLRHYQVPNAYDIVKKVTRGTQMSKDQYKATIEELLQDPVVAEKLPAAKKEYLLNLKPAKFIGESVELAGR